MGFADDPIAKKHLGYFFCLFFSWVACCVIFGGELHRANVDTTSETVISTNTYQVTRVVGTYYMFYDSVTIKGQQQTYTRGTSGPGPVTTSDRSGSTNYKQCTVDLCNKCYSGGAGAVSMAVFAWLCYLAVAVLRGLVLWQKNSSVPSIGESDSKYALVERVTVSVGLGLYILAIVAWGGGCMAATASSSGVSTVIPTGLVYVVLCIASSAGAIWLLQKIHEETGFGGSGGSKPNNAAAPTSAPAAAV